MRQEDIMKNKTEEDGGSGEDETGRQNGRSDWVK